MSGSNVPAAREILTNLLPGLDSSQAVEVRRALELMTRKPAHRKAPKASRKMTPELAKQIRLTAAAHPLMTQMEIATLYQINAGRVSEALNIQ